MKKHLIMLLLLSAANFALAQDEAFTIMPYPQTLKAGSGKLRITSRFTVSLLGAVKDKTLEDAAYRFQRRLNAKTLAYFEQERIILNQQIKDPVLSIRVKEKKDFNIGTDESYQLFIDTSKALLEANNTIGALRGLETLFQLVTADDEGYFFPAVEINDAPRFKWRGMMVDVSRHFLPVDVLKRNIDAMAMVKLNVLHLHLSDDEGFRVESKVFPRLQELGSNGQYYSQAQLKDLVNYAAQRGIMVYPEFDLPGHCQSWLAGYPELGSATGPYQPGTRYLIKPGTPVQEAIRIITDSAYHASQATINPAKESVYQFLDKFIGEMTTIFPSPYMHIGADESNGVAWKNNAQIVQFMKEKGIKDVSALQEYFVNRMHAILERHNRTMISWEDSYNADFPGDAIVQKWRENAPAERTTPAVAEKGHKMLISTGFYLDLHMPAYIYYLNQEIPLTPNPNLIGGEAALWSELVDENTFEIRAWPITAAIAERLWSPENIKDVDEMYRRLFVLSNRLQEAGLNNQLNVERILSSLSNDQDIQAALKIVHILAPATGYRRIFFRYSKPEAVNYLSTPLVNLPDMLSTDSKNAWQFRKMVESYLATNDPAIKTKIENQLGDWKEASEQVISQSKTAPNLKVFEPYATNIVKAADIALQALGKSVSENEKSAMIIHLKAMKNKEGEVDIKILEEIEALVTGTLSPLPESLPLF